MIIDSHVHIWSFPVLADVGDKISESERREVEALIAEVKEALEGEDGEMIKTKVEALQQAAMKLGEALYKAQQEETASAADGPDSGDGGDADAGKKDGDADVVDADFEEVDEQDRNKSA